MKILSVRNRKSIVVESLVCSLLLFIFGTSTVSAGDWITGKWAAENRTKGGLGGMLIFFRDGTVISSFGALVDFQYRVEGTKLTTIFRGGKEGSQEEAVDEFEITANHLILNPSDPAKREERTRASLLAPGKAPIVGIWTFKHSTGEMATWQYTSTGLAQLSIPFKTAKGSFKHKGEELTMRFDGEKPSWAKVRFEGNRLILFSGAEKSPRRYARVFP